MVEGVRFITLEMVLVLRQILKSLQKLGSVALSTIYTGSSGVSRSLVLISGIRTNNDNRSIVLIKYFVVSDVGGPMIILIDSIRLLKMEE